MIHSGTFFELIVKDAYTDSIPIILGQSLRGYFICLPDHDSVFEEKDIEDIDSHRFTDIMDEDSAERVATAVKRAISLLAFCGG